MKWNSYVGVVLGVLNLPTFQAVVEWIRVRRMHVHQAQQNILNQVFRCGIPWVDLLWLESVKL
jgi:hypothetical protein